MALSVLCLPRSFSIQQPLQLDQIVHPEPVKIPPAGNSKKIVDHDCGISLTSQALLANQLFRSLLGIIMIVVGIQQFHSVILIKFIRILQDSFTGQHKE
ncbi:hypothetical protein ALO65_200150 [Pseudomonas syringae pv. papulans]|nr:hypothetical protein ALO65_200150 [Pseudomonas syringae pv. papulans]KWS38366.1 hypothetical protein AL059_03735 [Pseudomonas syringae pv. papulans]